MNIVINLNKPENMSSQQAARKVRKLFTARKAGHAGTLDPMARGVLIVCLDEATKITRFVSDLDKEYVVRMKLGEKTDTYDSTGRIVGGADCRLVNETDIHEVLNNFVGTISQVPPMYSAVKLGGKPLYELARRGITVNRPARTVRVNRIDLLSFNKPFLDLRIVCSKGTYVRTLCDDMGAALGVGAHMVSLVRTRIGAFRIEDSLSIEDPGRGRNAFFSIDSALLHLEEVVLDENSYQKARNGVPIKTCNKNLKENQYVRLKSPRHAVFGIGKVANNIIKIERLLN